MRILAIAGSLRAGSYNRLLLNAAVAGLRSRAEVDVLEPADLALPLYDGDVETRDGLPAGAGRLKDRIAAADALVIATPEYNHSIPGGLKNAIDWASRPPTQPFRGRTALLLSASPSAYGGVRAQAALRVVLTALGVVLVPTTVMVANADKAFDAAGGLVDPRLRTQVEKACAELLRVSAALKA
jgi:chromate reductase